MFEKYIVNGIEHTKAELEYAAKAQNVDFETLISQLNAQVFKRNVTMDDIELNSQFIVAPEGKPEPRIKSWGGLVELEQVKESPITDLAQGALDKISRFAEGSVSIADNLTKGYETGEFGFIGDLITDGPFYSTLGYIASNLREQGYDVPERIGFADLTTPKERRAMYEAHLIDSAKKGLTLQEAQKLDPTNRIKLEGVLEWFDKYQYDVELDENGNPLDFMDLYGKGDIDGGSDALVQDVFSAAPSVIISRIPYGIGPAILGAGAYMENFERELYERLGEEVKESADLSYKNIGDKISRRDVVINSIIHGGSDFFMEFFGGRILNKIGKDIPKEQAKDILVNSTGAFFKAIAKGFGYEGLTEGATGVVQEAADALTYGDIKTFSNLGRAFVKDFAVGGILGAGSAATSAKDILSKRKRQEWFGTRDWKQTNLKLENELIETQKSYAKATTDSEKSFFENKIKEILGQKKKHKEDLYEFFDNLDGETLLAYAKNYDKAEQALDIINNNKYTKEQQDKAYKELQVINKKAEQFFENSTLEYNSKRQTDLSIALKDLESIRKQKGAIGTSNRNSRLVYMNEAKAKKLVEKSPELKGVFFSKDEYGNDVYDVQGVFINKAKDGKFDIYIDEINSTKAENTNVIGHENLHGIISFNFKKGIGKQNLISSVKSLGKYLIDNGYKEVVNDINKRLAAKYDAFTQNGQILVDENGIVQFAENNQDRYEEYFTMLSDVVNKEKLKPGDKDASKLVSSWNALMYGIGFKNIDFQNPESVFNFIKTYSKNITDDSLFGKLKAKAVSRAKAKGLEAKDKKDVVSKPKVDPKFSKSEYNRNKDPYSFVSFKTVPKEIVNSKSYKKWIKSLEGIKLFHGTTTDPNKISELGTNHSLNWFIVGGNDNQRALNLTKDIERMFDGEPENSVLSIDASELAGRILPDADFIGPSDDMSISKDKTFQNKIKALEDKYKTTARVQPMIRKPKMYAEFLDIITEHNPMSGYSQVLFDKNGKLNVNSAVVIVGGLKPNQLKVESIAPKFSKGVSRYTTKQRDDEMNELGEKYTRQEWIDGKAEEVYWDMWSKGYIEDMVKEQMSSSLKELPGFSEADFISQTAIELKKAFEGFDIDKKQTTQGKFGLAGWIGQNVKWKLNKVLRDGLATKQKFEDSLSDEAVASQVQEAISEEQDQVSFEDAPLLQEEINRVFKKEEELRGKAKGSILRTTLKNERNEGLPEALVQKFRDIVVDVIANEELKPGNTGQNRAFIKSIENKVYEKLRRDVQNFIQVGNYRQNTYDNALLILQELKTKELVAIEKKTPADERIFTKYIGRLTRKADIQKAIDLDLLPPEAVDFSDAGVDLRVKIQPETEVDIENFKKEVARFYNPPTFVRSKKDPNKTVRSGLRGTRRDALSGYLAKNMAEDAIPESLKDTRVIQGRTDVTKEVFDEAQALEITRAINKSIDHKFSKSAGRDIDNAIDGGDLSPFVHIKFSKKLRREFNSRLRARRPDEVDAYYDDQIDQVFKYADSLDESVYNRNKMQKLAFHYLINGSVILPEDGYKVTEAADFAQKNKVDPFSYKNPEDLINQFKKLTADKTLLDPETLPTFSNRQEFADGRVVIYDVADTKEGQVDVRKLADSHFGKSFNNWCLCARLGEYYSSDQAYSEQERDQMIAEQEAVGRSVLVEEFIEDGEVVYELTINDKKDLKDELKASFRHWQDYTGDLGFKAVFIDGKLKYFRSGNEGKYYDIKDEEHNEIEYKDTKVDKDGFIKVYSFNYNDFQKDQDESENLIKTDSYIYTAFYEKGSKDKKSGEYIKQEGLSRKLIERQFKNKNGELDGEKIVTTKDYSTQYDVTTSYSTEQTIVYKKGKKVKSTQVETTDYNEESFHTEILPSRLGGGLVEVRKVKTTVVKNYDENGVLTNVQRVLEGNLKPVSIRNILSGAISDMVPGINLSASGRSFLAKFDATVGGIKQNVDFNKKFVKGGKRIKITFNYDIDQIRAGLGDAFTSRKDKELITDVLGEGTIESQTAVIFGKPEFGKLENGEYQRIDKATNQFTLKNAKYEIQGENTVSVKINAADQTLKDAEQTVEPRIENAKFSRGMSERLNEMLERTAKTPADKIFSRADAQVAKKAIIKLTPFYLPPGAEDFVGLLYPMLGKGKKGDQDYEFFRETLIRPFTQANINLNTARMKILADFDKLKLRWKEVTKKLNAKLPSMNFTHDMAIRVYLFDKMGESVPGLTVEQQKNLVDRVKTDRMLLGFAENLQAILNVDGGYVTPSENWTGGTIVGDVYEVTEKLNRAIFFKDWIDNKKEIFNEDNLNKLQVIYGKNYRDALEDILFSMEKGKSTNRNNIDEETSAAYRWLQGTVATIMFFNSRTTITQLISIVNYINYKDNNPIQAFKALSNVEQFSKDFAMIMNSQYLQDRRGGLKTDVQHGEIAQALRGIKSFREIINDIKNGDNTSIELAIESIKSVIAYLAKVGFTPTQIADSTAISFGGASFYRNRVNTYLEQGLDQKQAEDKAFFDLIESSEESQQSSREDKISRQQKSFFGRLVLQFQNYPLQQNRIIKRTVQDLINKRGDMKTNLSRLAFYGLIQNLIFLSIQQALFALPFFDDDDEEVYDELLDTKGKRIINGILDTFLRGSGIAGGLVATAKNTLIKLYDTQVGKGDGLDLAVEAMNISPGIGGKGRQLEKVYRTIDFNKEAPLAMHALHPKNPVIQVVASTLEATINLPADRVLKKINNLVEITDTSRTNFERTLLFLGYSPFDMGITDVYEDVKQATREGKKMIKDFDPNSDDNTLMLRFLKTMHDEEAENKSEKRKKRKSTSKKCQGITSKGFSCNNNAQKDSDYCYAHQ